MCDHISINQYLLCLFTLTVCLFCVDIKCSQCAVCIELKCCLLFLGKIGGCSFSRVISLHYLPNPCLLSRLITPVSRDTLPIRKILRALTTMPCQSSKVILATCRQPSLPFLCTIQNSNVLSMQFTFIRLIQKLIKLL